MIQKQRRPGTYMIGENVMAKNYRSGPKWLPGVIVEQLETLTFLVQLDNGMFWKRHVNQLLGSDQSSSNNTDLEAAYTLLQILMMKALMSHLRLIMGQ